MVQLQAETRVVNDKMTKKKTSVIYIKWHPHGRKKKQQGTQLKKLKTCHVSLS